MDSLARQLMCSAGLAPAALSCCFVCGVSLSLHSVQSFLSHITEEERSRGRGGRQRGAEPSTEPRQRSPRAHLGGVPKAQRLFYGCGNGSPQAAAQLHPTPSSRVLCASAVQALQRGSAGLCSGDRKQVGGWAFSWGFRGSSESSSRSCFPRAPAAACWQGT